LSAHIEQQYINIEFRAGQWWDLLHSGAYYVLSEGKNYSRNLRISRGPLSL